MTKESCCNLLIVKQIKSYSIKIRRYFAKVSNHQVEESNSVSLFWSGHFYNTSLSMDPSQNETNQLQTVVTFKSRKRKNMRQRVEEEEDNNEQSSEWETLEELREIQRFKKRDNHGVNVEDLLKKNVSTKSTESNKIVLSGLQDKKTIIASELELGNTFSAETNLRDEDAEMSKFIEEELKKRKGATSMDSDFGSRSKIASNPEDLVFNVLPEHLLNAGKTQKNEEMLSSQMLSGIPEIDLGIDERIRNIEATEEAKMKHLYNRRNQKPAASNLVPTNIAVNFQQNRSNRIPEEAPFLVSLKQNKPEPPKPVVTVVEEPVVVIGDEPRTKNFKEYANSRDLRHPGRDKASDNYHFDRFRKQLRK